MMHRGLERSESVTVRIKRVTEDKGHRSRKRDKRSNRVTERLERVTES